MLNRIAKTNPSYAKSIVRGVALPKAVITPDSRFEAALKRAKIGDVVAIKSSHGFVIAYYTHQNQKYGAFIRVFWGFQQSTDLDYSEFVKSAPQLRGFFPLQSSLNQDIAEIVAHVPVLSADKPFPIFKTGTPNENGIIDYWWLWDGDKEWPVGTLSREQLASYPIQEIWNVAAIVDAVATGQDTLCGAPL